jgi:hypothetical protein
LGYPLQEFSTCTAPDRLSSAKEGKQLRRAFEKELVRLGAV